MALGSNDERDLLVPILDGIHEQPLWDTFLHRMVARTRARQVCLLIRPAQSAQTIPLVRFAARAKETPAADIETLSRLGLFPYATLRVGRVYALAEMASLDASGLRERQQAAMKTADIADARFVRIAARGDHHAWLLLLNDKPTFSASDSALLSALAGPLAAALGTLMQLDDLRLRAAMAEDALHRLGVGQLALGEDGRVLSTSSLPKGDLDVTQGGRLPLGSSAAQTLAEACGTMKRSDAGTLLRLDDSAQTAVLIAPAPASTAIPSPAAATAMFRRPRSDQRNQAAARVIASELGLSDREAALAEAMSNGASILQAGAALRLSPETARNYSKRIYAKTGARGQADLVRMVLTGLSPLA